jgi:hypothetical protein
VLNGEKGLGGKIVRQVTVQVRHVGGDVIESDLSGFGVHHQGPDDGLNPVGIVPEIGHIVVTLPPNPALEVNGLSGDRGIIQVKGDLTRLAVLLGPPHEFIDKVLTKVKVITIDQGLHALVTEVGEGVHFPLLRRIVRQHVPLMQP